MTSLPQMQPPLKKILVFIDWYLPGYKAGGPIKSCVSLVERLKTDYNFRIVTSDTDLNEAIPYEGVQPDKWITTSKGTEVFYCSRSFLSKKNIESILLSERPDIIYLNSMFSVYFTLLPLLAIRKHKIPARVVVAPRGMLSKGALALKPLKKKVFLMVSKFMGLFNNVTFHASTLIEVDEIKAVFGQKVRVQHAINLTPDVPVVKIVRKKDPHQLKLVYVGRISEVKNLLQCLRVLKKADSENQILFDIYGPHDNEDYLELCKKEIQLLPGNIKAVLKGPFDNAGITALLKNYHFLFLLSMNENYGHAIVEGFTAGCPVIIGNQTPWKNMEERKCGWDLPLDQEDKIINALNTAAAMNQQTYDEWSKTASDFAVSIHDNKKTIEDHHRLFEITV
ncbi:MAG: glycosyltransferase [Bacteroidota bacterium]|nr:glycosyltransferase [Bacteroidota bacterium]